MLKTNEQFDLDCERFMVGLSRISHSGTVDEYSYGRYLGFSNDYTDRMLDYLVTAQMIEFKATGLCNYHLTVAGCRQLIRKKALSQGHEKLAH